MGEEHKIDVSYNELPLEFAAQDSQILTKEHMDSCQLPSQLGIGRIVICAKLYRSSSIYNGVMS